MASRDIFERLIEDHEKHRQWIDALKETSGDSDERRSLFEQLKTDTLAHAAAEESSLYVAMMENEELRQDAQHSVKEHAEIGMLFVELDEMDRGSSGWLTKFKTLADEYLHHVDEEEQDKFPKSRDLLGEAKSVELKATFEELKPAAIERVRDKADVPEIKKAIAEEEGAK